MDAWDPVCYELLGLAPALLRSGAPSHPRLGNWQSDTLSYNRPPGNLSLDAHWPFSI